MHISYTLAMSQFEIRPRCGRRSFLTRRETRATVWNSDSTKKPYYKMFCFEKAFILINVVYLAIILTALGNEDGNGGKVIKHFYKIPLKFLLGKLSSSPPHVWCITCLWWINVILISILIWLLCTVVFHMIARPCPCGIGAPMQNALWITGPAPAG